MTHFQLKPSEVRSAVIDCMEVGLVPMVTSSPGIGKSDIIRQIAQDFNFEMIDIRLSQCAPEDLMGLPMRKGEGDEMRASFVPFEMFPTRGDPLPKGKNGWIVFFDEANTASKAVQAAAYKIILDRMIGQAHLHDDALVVCAGNLSTDRAIVNQMSTALQSRLIHIEMTPDHKDFMDYAVANDFDPRILGFLEFQPSKLHHFKPDHNDRTFACPRTWSFASRLIKGKPFEKISLPLLAGTISDGIAVELHTFIKEYANLPSYETIIQSPETTPVPSSSSTCYALVTMMFNRLTRNTFPEAAIYSKRLSPEFQVIYFKGVLRKDPSIRDYPAFRQVSLDIIKYLSEDDNSSVRNAA